MARRRWTMSRASCLSLGGRSFPSVEGPVVQASGPWAARPDALPVMEGYAPRGRALRALRRVGVDRVDLDDLASAMLNATRRMAARPSEDCAAAPFLPARVHCAAGAPWRSLACRAGHVYRDRAGGSGWSARTRRRVESTTRARIAARWRRIRRHHARCGRDHSGRVSRPP